MSTVQSCNPSQNLQRSCKGAVGGVLENIYICELDNVLGYTPSIDYPENEITALEFESNVNKFFKYQVKLNSGGNDNTAQGLGGTGSINWKQGVDFIIEGADPQAADEMRKLSFSRVVVVVQYKVKNTPVGSNIQENLLVIVGLGAGLILESNVGGSGKATTDVVGWTVRLSGEQTTNHVVVTPDQAIYTQYPNAPNRSFLYAISETP